LSTTVAVAMESARAGLSTQLEAFAANTMEYLRRERDLLLDGVGVPDIRTDIDGKHVLIVVRGERHRNRLSDVADTALGQRRPAAGDEARPGHDDRFQPERRGVEDVVGQRHGGERRVADRRADEGGFEGIGKLEVGQVDRLAENLHLGCTSRIASTIGV